MDNNPDKKQELKPAITVTPETTPSNNALTVPKKTVMA